MALVEVLDHSLAVLKKEDLSANALRGPKFLKHTHAGLVTYQFILTSFKDIALTSSAGR